MKKEVQTLKKVCKKILFIALLFVVISSNYANALFPIGNSYNSTTVYANSRQQRVVLFTRVLSRQEVKALAASQKNARNFANSFASTTAAISSFNRLISAVAFAISAPRLIEIPT